MVVSFLSTRESVTFQYFRRCAFFYSSHHNCYPLQNHNVNNTINNSNFYEQYNKNKVTTKYFLMVLKWTTETLLSNKNAIFARNNIKVLFLALRIQQNYTSTVHISKKWLLAYIALTTRWRLEVIYILRSN